jgi:hypothetical protein
MFVRRRTGYLLFKLDIQSHDILSSLIRHVWVHLISVVRNGSTSSPYSIRHFHFTMPSIRTCPHWWSWIGIIRRTRIYVKLNARIIPRVQARSRNTSSRCHRPRPSNLKVQALRVGLRTVVIICTVQCYDLVADNVVSGFQILWEYCSRNEAIFNESVGHPSVS